MIDHTQWNNIAKEAKDAASAVAASGILTGTYEGYVDPFRKLASGTFETVPAEFKLCDKPDHENTWIPVKSAAISDYTSPVTGALGLSPSWFTNGIGGPTPAISTIAGSMLGAAGGYTAGRIAENLLPERTLVPGRLRKNLMYLGAGAGAMPGVYMAGMGASMRPHGSFFKAMLEPNVYYGKEAAVEDEYQVVLRKSMEKLAQIGMGDAGAMFVPSIPVDAFNRVLLNDPFLPAPMAFATSGLINAADMSRGSSGIISPYDITRIAVGMGAGLTQAYLGGKLLGIVAGLDPAAQRQLQRTGAIAGAIKATVPGLFGVR